MRTTVTLADDVAAAVDRLRRSEGVGMSQAVNRLAGEGLAKTEAPSPCVHRCYDMGLQPDVTNIGEVTGLLNEFDPPY